MSTVEGRTGSLSDLVKAVCRDGAGEIVALGPSPAAFEALLDHLETMERPPTVRLLGRPEALRAAIAALDDPDRVTALVREEVLVIRRSPDPPEGAMLVGNDRLVVPLSDDTPPSGLVAVGGELPTQAFDAALAAWLAGDTFWLPHAPAL